MLQEMTGDRVYSTRLGDHEVTLKTGKMAEQAGGAVTFQVGDSLLLATATMSKSTREGMNFFPLSVDFEEKIYAAGRIPGSFFRREGRPSTEAILMARLTDRALRPLFPDGMRNEVQIIVTALSSDAVHFLDIMTLNAASAALIISDIPWNGPVAAVRVGYIDGQFVADPTIPQMVDSELDLRLAGTRDAIIMVEAGANEVPEEVMIDALEFGHRAMQPFIDLQLQMREEIGKEKREIEYLLPELEMEQATRERMRDRIREILRENPEKADRNEAMDEFRETFVEDFIVEAESAEVVGDEEEEVVIDPVEVREVFSDELKKVVRQRILEDGIRPDGRGYTEIRPLSSEVGISPRAHGSALFSRGQTQVLSIATLGTPRDAQKIDGLTPEDTRRFMHHYNFPPYSTGETWFLRGPKRREIGHGMLAQTALRPVVPEEDEFPYTIRVVSEVLSSNGSTSQASICAMTLALMDCGVPIKAPVAGIAMGLIKEGERYAILTDIQGVEDHLGDMDFKVAGTRQGITALQMDMKVSGLSRQILAEALEQARGARLHILDHMAQTMAAPREQLNRWAPRMETIKIDPDKIGAVIGKGGSTIRSLEEEFEVSIDIQEDGTIFVAGVDGDKTDAALDQIRNITQGAELGNIYSAKVVRIVDFGLFVEVVPGTDAFVHISQLASNRVERVEDVVKMGDEIMVMVTDIEEGSGKVRASRQAVLEGWTLEEARANDAGVGKRSGGGRRNGGGGRRR